MKLKAVWLALTGSLIVLATACGDSGDTYVQTGNAPVTGINATGVGEAVGKPDVMVLTVGVSAQRPGVEEAREAAAGAQTAVIDALKKNGVAEKDIQTVQFNVSPVYDYSNLRGDSQQIIGYMVSNVVRAKVRNLEKAGDAIDAATTAGGNDAVVQGVWFGIDDPTELQKPAREQAVKKAKEQAQQLADNAGAKLGKLLSISESGYYPTKGDFYAPATGLGAADAQTTTPVQSGELTISVTVTVLYAVD
jgi:uncharacterized protein YggE